MEVVLSEKLEKASLETAQEVRKQYDDETLSELSCSTANNEDFYDVLRQSLDSKLVESDNNKDKDAAVHNKVEGDLDDDLSAETPVIESKAPAAGDAVQQLSIAAQTNRVLEKKNIPEPFHTGYYGVRPHISGQYTPRVHRIYNSGPSPMMSSHSPEFRAPSIGQFRFPMAPPVPSFLRSPQKTISYQGPRTASISQMSYTDPPLRLGTSSSLSMHRSSQPIPMKQFDAESCGQYTYPLIHVSPAGTISLVVAVDLLIEMAVDRSIRIVSHDHFAITINARGTSSAILHQRAKILHQDENVWCKFTSSNDKMCAFSPVGVFFTMSHLQEGYLVSTNAPMKGAVAVQLDPQQFSSMDQDFTIKLFYTEAQSGQQFLALCKDLVHEATYERRPDGTLSMNVNGMHIRHHSTGELHVDARPRQISCNPRSCNVQLRSPYIDMAVQSEEKAYVKRSTKRVHVSRSGMVVSDGNCITSMDHFGRIVSCT